MQQLVKKIQDRMQEMSYFGGVAHVEPNNVDMQLSCFWHGTFTGKVWTLTCNRIGQSSISKRLSIRQRPNVLLFGRR